MTFCRFLILTGILFVPFFSVAQYGNRSSTDERIKRKLERDSVKATKNLRYSFFAGPGASPELGFVIGTANLFTFKTNSKDSVIQRSSIAVNIAYGTVGAIVLNSRGRIFYNQDRFRIFFNTKLKIMPDHYFGIGYDAGRNTPKGETTTAYQKFYWVIQPRLMWKIDNNLFLGGIIDLNQTIASGVNPTMAADPVYIEFGDNNFNSGIGANFFYDSRDMVVNCFKGIFLNISSIFYLTQLGSDNRYVVSTLDYRQYKSLFTTRSTLAWTIKSNFGIGDIPYGEMPTLGSSHDLRGYLTGQYRDKTSIFGLIEYRYMFSREPVEQGFKLLKRTGLVFWIGGGFLGDQPNDWKDFLPNAGLGLRIEIQPRMNLRFDYGFGVESMGFYLSVNEAF